jgi:hypothetical protein
MINQEAFTSLEMNVFERLPPEMLSQITSYLSDIELFALGGVSRWFREFFRDERLWKSRRIRLKFGHSHMGNDLKLERFPFIEELFFCQCSDDGVLTGIVLLVSNKEFSFQSSIMLF